MNKSTGMLNYIGLARKYRPNKMDDIVGQDELVQTLSQAFKKNQIPHAIILNGIRGVGKTTAARILAKGLNCIGSDGKKTKPTVNPCGECTSCISIQNDRHLDVIEMDAASHTSVDDIREIIETSRYKAVLGRYKVYIIDEVHMISKSAFNALLKTLEEPPSFVVFIFATTEIQKVPDTILSRCMRFDLKRIDHSTIQKRIINIAEKESISIEVDAASTISHAADGSLRDALSLLDQALATSNNYITAKHIRDMLGFASKESLYDLVNIIFDNNFEGIFDLTKKLYQQGIDPLMMLKDIMDIFYWVICLKTLPQLKSDVSYPEFERSQGEMLSKKIPLNAILQMWQVFTNHQEFIGKSHNPLHAFQILCLQVIYLSNLPSLDSFIEADSLEKKALTSPDNNNADISSFDDILKLCKEHKEVLIYSHLIHSVAFQSLTNNQLTLIIKKKIDKNFEFLLKAFLEKTTSATWTIIINPQSYEIKSHLTVAEKATKLKCEKEKQIQNHPLIQKILLEFPNASIKIENS